MGLLVFLVAATLAVAGGVGVIAFHEPIRSVLSLVVVMLALSRHESLRARFGWLTGAFLVGYAIARTTCEFFREPDVFLGFLIGGVTMGQLLCIPMLVGGLWLILRTR